jgi:hypothetical protein
MANLTDLVLTNTNPVPPETGGTGLTSPGASGNTLVSDGTTWVSQAPAPSGVTTGKAIAMAIVFG